MVENTTQIWAHKHVNNADDNQAGNRLTKGFRCGQQNRDQQNTANDQIQRCRTANTKNHVIIGYLNIECGNDGENKANNRYD